MTEDKIETLRLAANLSLEDKHYRAFAHILIVISDVTSQAVVFEAIYRMQEDLFKAQPTRILEGALVKCGAIRWVLDGKAFGVVTSIMATEARSFEREGW